jgi:hypothetical protein
MPFCFYLSAYRCLHLPYFNFDDVYNFLCRFLGDENGMFSVLKYDLEDGEIKTMPYHIPLDSLAGAIIFTLCFLVNLVCLFLWL